MGYCNLCILWLTYCVRIVGFTCVVGGKGVGCCWLWAIIVCGRCVAGVFGWVVNCGYDLGFGVTAAVLVSVCITVCVLILMILVVVLLIWLVVYSVVLPLGF